MENGVSVDSIAPPALATATAGAALSRPVNRIVQRFADLRAPKLNAPNGPIRERATKNRSAFVGPKIVSADHAPLSDRAKHAAQVDLKSKTTAAEAQKTKAKDAFNDAQGAKKDAAAAHEKAAESHEKIRDAKASLEKLKNKAIKGPAGEHAANSRNAEVQKHQAKITAMNTGR